uniref:G domain-containing protein n=1 Tax=Neogobius melanostomus TaxID=47308 RepID=A0A8C6SJJ7_9GOBI
MASGFNFGSLPSTTSATTVPTFSVPPCFNIATATRVFGASTTVTPSSTDDEPVLSTLRQINSARDTAVSSTDKEAKKPGFKFGTREKPSARKAESNSSGEDSIFPTLPAPWRSVEWTEEEKSDLLERLSSYTPSSRDIPQARVLLLGPVGSGKSSFISSAQSVFDGRVTTRAMVGHGASSSFTRKLQSFPLRARDGARDGARDSGRDRSRGYSTALVLCDMMGFGDEVLGGPTLQHMLSVIKGHAPEGYKFQADQALSSDTEGYVKRPGLREQMHCVAFVLDASKVRSGSYSKGISGTFQQLRRYISDMGVHQVVLLTHIDKICPETAKNTSEAYRSIFVRDTIYKAAELVGISVSSVVPVRNYWCELDLDLSSDVLLLRALDHILQYSELLFTEKNNSTSKD